jgi:hypothetical protein
MTSSVGAKMSAGSDQMMRSSRAFELCLISRLPTESGSTLDLRQILQLLQSYRELLPLTRCSSQLWQSFIAKRGLCYAAVRLRFLKLFQTAIHLSPMPRVMGAARRQPVAGTVKAATAALQRLERRDLRGENALHSALKSLWKEQRGTPDRARRLITLGINVNLHTGPHAFRPHASPLMIAIGIHDVAVRIEIMDLLCKKGADVNQTGSGHDSTPLIWVCSAPYSNQEREAMIALLLKHRASVHIATRHGETALHAAARNNYSGRLLFQAGAKADSPDMRGKTAADAALKYGNIAFLAELKGL